MARRGFPTGLALAGVLLAVGLVGALLLLDEPSEHEGAGRGVDTPAVDARPGMEVAPIDGGPSRAAEESLVVRDATRVDAPPVAERRITGRILRIADRTPVVGVPVRAPGGSSSTTDAAGGFGLARVPVDVAALVIDVGGRPVGAPLPDEVGDLLDLELIVDTGFTIEGDVVSVTGVPVPEASVRWGTGQPVTSDEAGSFRLPDVAPGVAPETVVLLHAEAAWFVRAEAAVRLPASSAQLAHVTIVLEPAGALAGTIRNEVDAGAARAGGRVRVRYRFEPDGVVAAPASMMATTDAEGRYVLASVPEGRYVVSAEGLGAEPVPVFRAGVIVVEGQTTRLDFHLLPGASVSGVVTDSVGDVVADTRVEGTVTVEWVTTGASMYTTVFDDGTRVQVREGSGSQGALVEVLTTPVRSTRTDSAGRYELSGLPAGFQPGGRLESIRVAVMDPDYPGRLAGLRVAYPSPGAHLANLDITLSSGAPIRGRVFDDQGQPMEGVRIANLRAADAMLVMDDGSAVSTADGRFEFVGIPDERVDLIASFPGYQSVLLEDVVSGGPELRIDMQPAALVEVILVDADTGHPLTRCELQIENESMIMTRPWSSPDGRFLVDVLEVGTYTFTVAAPGYESETIEDVMPSRGVPLPLHVALRPRL